MIKYYSPSLKDCDKIFELGKKEFNWIFEKISWDKSMVEWYLDYYTPYCFVASNSEKIIGFLLSFIKNDIGYLGWVCVDEKYRRGYVANKLLQLTIGKMEKNTDIKNIYAHVRDDKIIIEWMKKRYFLDISEKKVEMKYCIKG